MAVAAPLAAAAAILLFQLSLAGTRTHDPDEFQHAHSAFLIAQGQRPYLDYFEHHPPLLHFALAPVIASLHPERSGQRAFETLEALRVICWVTGLVGLSLHHVLARRVVGAAGASIASLLLISTLCFFEKTIEIRPDTAAFALLQLGLLALLGKTSTSRSSFAGSAFGLGLLLTQKLGFPVLGALVLPVHQALSSRSALRTGAVALTPLLAGLLWPTVLCAIYFAAQGGLGVFVEDVFLINLRWQAHLAPWPFFVSRFVMPNWFFAAAGALGFLVTGRTILKAKTQDESGRTLVWLSAMGGVAGLVLLPVAWEQYYLCFLPQVAILAADALMRTARLALRRHDALAAAAAAAITLGGVYPTRAAILAQGFRINEAKVGAITTLLDNSSPTEPVLDGYTGIGVFRPSAFRYFFFHAEMRLMLEASTLRELETGLASGAIAPRFVSGDGHLRSVSVGVRDLIDREYAPVGVGPLLARIFPGGVEAWDDHAPRFPGRLPPPRGPYVLALDGWGGRESYGASTFRRSRGKVSSLLFPALDPAGPSTLSMSVRAGARLAGLSARVSLNGANLGEIPLPAAFHTAELAIPTGVLVRGFNRLQFTFPVRPAQLDPATNAMDNSAMAIERFWLGAAPSPESAAGAGVAAAEPRLRN